MQRRGHMGRAHYGASQSRPTEIQKIKSLRDLMFVVCIFFQDLEPRHLTSNLVRTYFAFDRCGLFLGRIDEMIKKKGSDVELDSDVLRI